MESLLFKGALVIDPQTGLEDVRDVRVAEGRIDAIDNSLEANSHETVLQAAGLWLTPGFIDIHTHLRDLGQKDKEDIQTGSRAAAAGGYTTVVAMANTDPPLDNGSTFAILQDRVKQHAVIDVRAVACVTKGLQGAELTNMAELADLGAVAFSDDGMCIANLAVLRRALEYAKMTGKCVISHPEDKDLSGGGSMQECAHATAYGIKGIPAASETAAIAREIEIVRATNAPYHFTHVSCAASVKLIQRAKEDGLPITADVTPHHIALSVDEIEPFDTHFKMKPPLRLETDKAALIEGLRSGVIDAIATDHAPHTRQEKQTTFEDAAVGIIGLETAFSLCHEALVSSGALDRRRLIELFTTRPAAVVGLDVPGLAIGRAANLTLIDPGFRWVYDPRSGASKSHNTPFGGRLMTGKPVITVHRGKAVYRDESFLASRN